MSLVEFHTHIDDTVQYACRLLRKAVASGNRVVVAADAALAQRLDAALWTFAPLEFLSHASSAQAESLIRRSAVLLLRGNEGPGHVQAVQTHGSTAALSLGSDQDVSVDWWRSMPRVMELVGASEQQLAAGRQRFKAYRAERAAAHEIKTHRMS